MRDGIDRLLDIQEAIKEIERYAVRGETLSCRTNWCRSGWSTVSRSSGKQPPASPDFRSASPGVPWKQVIGLRNVLVHAYFRVDPEEVWAVVNRDIPALREEVAMLLSLLGGTDGAG